MTKNKLGNYLALTLGAGAAATTAQAATTVTLYGPGAEAPVSFFSQGGGFNMALLGNVGSGSIEGYLIFFNGGNSDMTLTRGFSYASYLDFGSGAFSYGAQAGAANYASLSLDGDEVYESVGQFFFDGNGGGYLIAITTEESGSALAITAGKAAIDGGSVSAVPEPSSHLALLALGSSGLLMRRRMAHKA